jgi:hypothetical protein
MTDDPHNVRDILVGTPVVGFGGSLLGVVHEVHPHYLLVGQEGQHGDLEVPVHAIQGFSDGKLQVSVTRESASPVDDVETAHRMNEESE